jgi:multidrug efflux pump subunit AcrB
MTVLGLSGKIAGKFINSKLTPLIVGASLLLGVYAIWVTPREEEPQIIVPMVDVMVSYPGASAKEIESRVTTPMEKLLWEIKGVEYVYSIVRPGYNLTIVRFYVGQNAEDSLVKLYNKLMSHYDELPQGISEPLVKAKSIDDVPILTLTMYSRNPAYTGYDLRRIALEASTELKKGDNVSEVSVTGGEKRQIRISLDPQRLDAYGVSPFGIIEALKQSNAVIPSGNSTSNNLETVIETGNFLKNADDVSNVVVNVFNGRPVYLKDVAAVTDGPQESTSYVFMGLGPAFETIDHETAGTAQYPAVTISLSKKKGANASIVSEDAIKKIEAIKGSIIPSDVNVTVTRDYGETAKEKSNELLEHMMIATISVIILIAFALGWREAVVVAVAVPVTLALTMLINYLFGYTLNRVTLFALIFSIGILVDDAIVVVENINRHFRMHGIKPLTAVLAVDEVGNPTILATFAVIAALLPMALVSGLMGPYMRPIPVGASAAMLVSLLVAFIVSPWLAYKVLRKAKHASHGEEDEGTSLYGKLLRPLIDSRVKRNIVLSLILCLLVFAMMLVPLKAVTLKMLPFDNKSEAQVIIDMPEGTTLEQTLAVSNEMSAYLKTVPEVKDYQIYAGAPAPYNFNGLVRHYYMRSSSNMADIQINLADKSDRKAQSHEIAKRLRPPLKAIGDRYGARIKIAEIPPGPPVLSTLVAEVYGPDENRRIEIARQIRDIFEKTPGVVDVDWMVEDDQPKVNYSVNKDKAALNGIGVDAVAASVRIALNGEPAGLAHMENEKEPVDIMLRMPEDKRSDPDMLESIGVPTSTGSLVPLSELVTPRIGIEDKTIYHKNLKQVVYVTADVAGKEESPVYAILNMKKAIEKIRLPEGYSLKQYSSKQPWLENTFSMKWDGEWHITYEVFRDLGIAFAAVLVIIYILVVAWFRSFVTPLVIMAPIPLTLVGILPGHWIFGAFFTATSMIGFIALAGIVVRNSILLVDFIQMEWREKGELKEALIKAGAVRFRPIVLTAAAVVVGSFVMLFDPIFQGLAISMMFGAVASTALTLIIVPLMYYIIFRNRPCPDCMDNKRSLDEHEAFETEDDIKQGKAGLFNLLKRRKI